MKSKTRSKKTDGNVVETDRSSARGGPGESPYCIVFCADGQKRRWFYDDSLYFPAKGWYVKASINKFNNLCHVEVVDAKNTGWLYRR